MMARAMVQQTADEDAQRVGREYDPTWEMVTVLLKARDRTSVYRVGVLGHNGGRQDEAPGLVMPGTTEI